MRGQSLGLCFGSWACFGEVFWGFSRVCFQLSFKGVFGVVSSFFVLGFGAL